MFLPRWNRISFLTVFNVVQKLACDIPVIQSWWLCPFGDKHDAALIQVFKWREHFLSVSDMHLSKLNHDSASCSMSIVCKIQDHLKMEIIKWFLIVTRHMIMILPVARFTITQVILWRFINFPKVVTTIHVGNGFSKPWEQLFMM